MTGLKVKGDSKEKYHSHVSDRLQQLPLCLIIGVIAQVMRSTLRLREEHAIRKQARKRLLREAHRRTHVRLITRAPTERHVFRQAVCSLLCWMLMYVS